MKKEYSMPAMSVVEVATRDMAVEATMTLRLRSTTGWIRPTSSVGGILSLMMSDG